MSGTQKVEPSNGEIINVADSLGRKIVLKTMGPADMLDLVEAAGANSGNQGWVNLAMVVCSVQSIDGVPVPRAVTKDQVKRVARLLGNEGMVACSNELFGSKLPDPTEKPEDGAEPPAPGTPNAAEQAAIDTAKN